LAKAAAALRQSAFATFLEKHLFIAMPYANEFNNAYYFGIKQPIEKHHRKPERVDQVAFTGDVVERVRRRISSCQLVIADITGNNPNVFYELGYADGVGKPVIVISQEQAHPFDVTTRHQIRYHPHDIMKLAEELNKHLDELIGPAED
jgi:nucleoside 2-deoxyribosyltransferase